jgi:prolyl-tRNA synthetase
MDSCLEDLKSLGITFTSYTHAAVMTSEEHAALPELASVISSGTLVKNLYVKDKKGNNYLVVITHERKVSWGVLGKQLGVSGGLRVDQKTLEAKLGVVAGSVTPLAVANDTSNAVIVVLDQKLDIGAGQLLIHPLVNTATVSISADDVKRYVEAKGNTLRVIDMDAAPPEPAKAAPKNKPKQQKKKKKGEKKEEKKNIDGITASKSGNFALWYQQVVKRSGMIEYYDISGCYIFRPWSFRIWEFITQFFDSGIKKMGVQNAYFPLFVTKKALTAEADHIEGFAPECAWVTHSGSSELPEPIAVRPTSETIMYPAYAKWIRSHRDLPLKLNQWTNVVRWEFSNPTPFIRSREFLWQEGHSAFATRQEAEIEVLQILNLYASVYEDLLAIPVTKGKKTEREKFAGGLFTTTVEAYVPETGRGIQGATSHCLGQNFSKMFNISFLDEKNQNQLVWQNSWGLSTRSIGAMVMIHADDKGLVLPPTVAPIQVVIVPVYYGDDTKQAISDKCTELAAELKALNLRPHIDDSPHNPGWKFYQWELKGVPLRIEVGPRDLANSVVTVAQRHSGAKGPLAMSAINTIPEILRTIYTEMYNTAKAKKEAHLKKVHTWSEFMTTINSKCVALAPWCGNEPCEEKLKQRSAAEAVIEEVAADENDTSEEAATANTEKLSGAAKSLCVPLRQPTLEAGTLCVNCGQAAVNYTMFGRSY